MQYSIFSVIFTNTYCCTNSTTHPIKLTYIIGIIEPTGSRDNISAVVVKLPGAKLGNANGGGVMARRAERAEQEKASESNANESNK